MEDDQFCSGCYAAWLTAIHFNKPEQCILCQKIQTEESGKNTVGWYTDNFIMRGGSGNIEIQSPGQGVGT